MYLTNTAISWTKYWNQCHQIITYLTLSHGSRLLQDDAIWYKVFWFALMQVNTWIQENSKLWLRSMLIYCWFVIWGSRNKFYWNSNPFMYISFQKICLKLFVIMTTVSISVFFLEITSLIPCMKTLYIWRFESTCIFLNAVHTFKYVVMFTRIPFL